jgi:hypothetical protein
MRESSMHYYFRDTILKLLFSYVYLKLNLFILIHTKQETFEALTFMSSST